MIFKYVGDAFRLISTAFYKYPSVFFKKRDIGRGDPPVEIKSVHSAVQCDTRFLLHLRRKSLQILCRYIRRV